MLKAKKICSTLICIIILILLFVSIESFLTKKISYEKNADFYDYSDNYEVLFLGTSHMIMGVAPMELWNDYGITSYNMANYGQWLPVDYWVLKNALDYTKPELVVIDVHAIGFDDKYSQAHVSQMHEVFDIMPLTKNKVEAVRDLLPKERYMEFLFPFSFYHSRWNEIDVTFWDDVEVSTEKGANLDNSNSLNYASVNECEKPVLIDTKIKNENDTTGKVYLKKIIELCQEEDIKIVLVALPYVPTEEEQKNINSATDIAEEYNISYLNMNLDNNYINFYTDMYDAGHLNSSGARKTTKVLGEYLINNFELKNMKESNVAVEWNEDYLKYSDYKVQWLKQQTDFSAYLMLLTKDKYKVVIEVNDCSWTDNIRYLDLLENLGVETELLGNDTKYILINSQENHAEVIECIDEFSGESETIIGEFVWEYYESSEADEKAGYDKLYVDGQEIIIEEKDDSSSINIIVISTLTNNVVDNVSWTHDKGFIR